MTTDLNNLKIDEVAFVDKGAGKGVKVTLFKRYNEELNKMKTFEELMAELSEEDGALILQALEEAKTAEADKEEDEADKAYVIEGGNKGDESKTKPGEKDFEDEEVGKALKNKFSVLKAENQSLEKRLMRMEEDKERESFIKRAEVFPNVPTFSTEELGTFLMQINKNLDSDMAEKAESFISAVNEICGQSSLLKEYGSAGNGATLGASAMAQAETMAKALMQTEKITKAVALNQVWEQNPELRNRYRAERRGK